MIPDFHDETERAVWAAAFAKGDPHSNWEKHSALRHANWVLQGYRELRSLPDAYRAGS